MCCCSKELLRKYHCNCLSPKQFAEDHETVGIVLRKENSQPANEDSEEEEECKLPDIERDDLATRRARMNQPKVSTPFNQYIGSYITKTKPSPNSSNATTACFKRTGDKSKEEHQDQPAEKVIILKENLAQRSIDNESDQEEEEKVPDVQRDDLAKRKTHGSVTHQKEPLAFGKGSITKADMATWQRLKLSSEERCGFFSVGFPTVIFQISAVKFCFFFTKSIAGQRMILSSGIRPCARKKYQLIV